MFQKRYSIQVFVIFYLFLSWCAVFFVGTYVVQAQTTSVLEQSQSQCQDKVRVYILTQEMGSTLWVDGHRVGRIPVSSLCLSSGLHLFSLQRAERSRAKAKKAKQIFWIPNQGEVTIDLRSLRLKSSVELSYKGKDHRVSPPLRTQVMEPQQVGQLTLMSELITYLNQPKLNEYFTIGDGVNAYQIIYKTQELPKLYTWTLDLITYKDLWSNTRHIHSQVPWAEPKLNLFIRQTHVKLHLQQIAWIDVQLGRQLISLGGRTVVGDGVKLLHDIALNTESKWSLKPTLQFMLDRSASVDRFAQLPVDNDHWFITELHLNKHNDEETALISVSTLTSLGNEQEADLYNLSGLWDQANLLVNTHLSLNGEGRLSFTQAQFQLKEILPSTHLKSSITYHSGDQWDQRWVQGERWPQSMQNSNLTLFGSISWSHLTLATHYLKGGAPTWIQSNRPPSADGQSRLVSIAWGDMELVRYQRPIRLYRQFEVQTGWGIQWSRINLDEVSQNWGQSPDSQKSSPQYNSLSLFTIAGSQQFKINTHEIKVSLLVSTEILQQFYWPELSVAWTFETVGFNALCGRPTFLPHLLVPNHWLSYCGVKLTIETPVRL